MADFNGDGIQDLAVANDNTNFISVLFGNGDGTLQDPRSIEAGTNPVPSPWATSTATEYRTSPSPTLAREDRTDKAHSVYFPVAWVTLIPRLAPLGLAADEARKTKKSMEARFGEVIFEEGFPWL